MMEDTNLEEKILLDWAVRLFTDPLRGKISFRNYWLV